MLDYLDSVATITEAASVTYSIVGSVNNVTSLVVSAQVSHDYWWYVVGHTLL